MRPGCPFACSIPSQATCPSLKLPLVILFLFPRVWSTALADLQPKEREVIKELWKIILLTMGNQEVTRYRSNSQRWPSVGQWKHHSLVLWHFLIRWGLPFQHMVGKLLRTSKEIWASRAQLVLLCKSQVKPGWWDSLKTPDCTISRPTM